MVKLFLKNGTGLLLISVYRVLFVSVITFMEEITELLEMMSASCESIILAGDVNIHIDDDDDTYSNRFKDILHMFNIRQHINVPTHIHGHTLDIVATYEDGPVVSGIEVNRYDLSHHSLVDFTITVTPKISESKTISYRNLKNIDHEKFTSYIENTLSINDSLSFGENIQQYNDVMRRAIDEFAPIKSRSVKIVPNAPWFDHEYANLRRCRRKAERRFRKTGLATHKNNFVTLRKATTLLAHKKKCKYLADKLEKGNPRILYSTINQLLDKNQEIVLPDFTDEGEMANAFLQYFSEKIDKIRATFDDESDLGTNVHMSVQIDHKFSTFESVSEDDVHKIVMSFGVKCSPEDPIPSKLLKHQIDFFVPIWTKLVNLSLRLGSMDCLKNAILLPLIKDLDTLIDRDNLKNYRPVSNLLFLGKLIERIVSMQLDKHMSINNLHSDIQYGYKKDTRVKHSS